VTDIATIQRLVPELTLVLSAAVIFVGSAFRVPVAGLRTLGQFSVLFAALLLVGPGTVGSLPSTDVASTDLLIGDGLGLVLRWTSLISAAIFLFGGSRAERADALEGERIGLSLLVFAGCMLASVAADFSLLFVAMELVSIPTYTLLFVGRRTIFSAEASIKYFLLSIFSSAFFLFGLAWMYMLTGTTSLVPHGAAAALGSHAWSGMWPWGVLFVWIGLGFKLAAFPLHFYAPDVYQGATPMNAALLAVAPKIAGMAGLLRMVECWGPNFGAPLVTVFVLLPIVTVTVGNIGALWQRHVRRLLAYSSIAHAGYLTIGIAVVVAGKWPTGWNDGVTSILLYLMAYSVATLGAFCILAGLRIGGQVPEDLDELAGLARREPWMAAALSVCLFSMAGIPPLAGFWGKLGLISGAVRAAQVTAESHSTSRWLFVLAVVAMLNAAIAAAYYLRFIGILWFRQPPHEDVPQGESVPRQVGFLCAALLIVIGLYPQPFAAGFRGAALHARQVTQQSPERPDHGLAQAEDPAEFMRPSSGSVNQLAQ